MPVDLPPDSKQFNLWRIVSKRSAFSVQRSAFSVQRSAFHALALSLFLLCSTVIESNSAFAAPAASSTASSPPATPGQSPASCGATIEDNLAAAQKAVQADDKATRAALACLIEATAALNRQVQNLDQGRSPAGALRVPTLAFPPARDQ